MKEEDLEPLRRALNEKCGLTEEDFVPKIHIDVPMPISYASRELAKELERLEPFGVGNPKPLFAQKDLVFVAGSYLGKNKNFARFQVRDEKGGRFSLVFFGNLSAFGEFLDAKYGQGSKDALFEGRGEFPVSITYQLGLNTFRGRTELQFVMQDYC